MIRLAIAGATGRTGQRVLTLATQDDRFTVSGALTADGCSLIGTTVPAAGSDVKIVDSLDAPCDVLIDFSVPEGTMSWLEVCQARGIPLVTGVTGHSEDQLGRLHRAAKDIAIVRASNFSVGVQAMLGAVARLARELGAGYDVEIVETHHRHKIDAPSGTALTLADEIAAATGRSRDSVTFGREGRVGERPSGQIGVHAVRMGEIVGQHEVHFSGPGETLTLRHTAHSRDTFAAGALRAAAWVVGKQPGAYTMSNVIG